MNTKNDQLLKFAEIINDFKLVERLSLVKPGGRRESDAEHTWHILMLIWLFVDSYEVEINLLKAFKMALVHDLAEIYAGDVYAFDDQGRIGKKEREEKAVKKLFAQLPKDLKQEFHSLYEEYEERLTEESKFVHLMDKLHPRLQYWISKGDLSDKIKVPSQKVAEQDTLLSKDSKLVRELITKLRLLNSGYKG